MSLKNTLCKRPSHRLNPTFEFNHKPSQCRLSNPHNAVQVHGSNGELYFYTLESANVIIQHYNSSNSRRTSVSPYFLRRLDTWMFPKRQGWRVWSRKNRGKHLFAENCCYNRALNILKAIKTNMEITADDLEHICKIPKIAANQSIVNYAR